MPDPTKEACVQALMILLREEMKVIPTNDPEISRQDSYLVYQCASGSRFRNTTPEVRFQKGTGFTNPFDHQCACYKPRQQIYADVRRKLATAIESQGGLSSQEIFEGTSSEREKAILSYLELIVMTNAPLSCVENEYYRNFSKHDYHFSRRWVKQILFSVAEKVENRISAEMKSTKGAIMHDGWTFGRCHYIGLLPVYVRNFQGVRSVAAPLLCMSLMNSLCKCSDSSLCECTEEVTEFDADTHAQHIKDVFTLYSVNFKE